MRIYCFYLSFIIVNEKSLGFELLVAKIIDFEMLLWALGDCVEHFLVFLTFFID